MIKYHEIPLKKFNKQEMNSLVRDVERSRIAVVLVLKIRKTLPNSHRWKGSLKINSISCRNSSSAVSPTLQWKQKSRYMNCNIENVE